MAAAVGTKLNHPEVGKVVAVPLSPDARHTCAGCSFFTHHELISCPGKNEGDALWCSNIIWVKYVPKKKVM